MSGTQVLDQTALAALVMVALSVLKPLVERLPFAFPGAPLHDYVMRGLLGALNVAALVVQGLATNTLAPAHGQNWATVVLWLLYQAAIASGLSHLAYQGLTKLGGGASSSDPAGMTASSDNTGA